MPAALTSVAATSLGYGLSYGLGIGLGIALGIALGIGLGYGLGCVLGGDVMRALAGGTDLRKAGSGNVGATNALRTRGAGFALGVLAIDIGKGVLAVLAIPMLSMRAAAGLALAPLVDSPPNPSVDGLIATLPFVCGAAVTIGHCYPLTRRFRGGKGVATLAGVFGALLPAALPCLLLAFAAVVLLTGLVSLASITAGVAALFYVSCFGAGFWSSAGAFAAAMLLLLVIKHRGNLVRLSAGTEPRLERARLLGRLLGPVLDRLVDRLTNRWRGRLALAGAAGTSRPCCRGRGGGHIRLDIRGRWR